MPTTAGQQRRWVSHTQLRGAGGFRNVLVHEYAKVDLQEVVRFTASAPRAFRAFARDVLHWMEGQTTRR